MKTTLKHNGLTYTDNPHLDAMTHALVVKRLENARKVQRVAGWILAGCLLAPCALFVVWQIVAGIIN